MKALLLIFLLGPSLAYARPHVPRINGKFTGNAAFGLPPSTPFSVVIDEIYPDPTPSHGLPEYEYVEIKNESPFPVDLTGWRFCDPVRCSIFPKAILPADSLLILCNAKNQDAFVKYGRTLGLKHFPSLNNSGDNLTLKDTAENVIYAISYDKSTYHNADKAKGGWSLEMKRLDVPCLLDGNWTASQDQKGGTPGTENSPSADDKQPFLNLKHVAVIDSVTVEAGFNAGLDATIAMQAGHFTINNTTIRSVEALLPLYNQVRIHLNHPLKKGKIYSLNVQDLKACGDLTIGLQNTIAFGIPEQAMPENVVINEILFNPRKDSKDFVELYNTSQKIIDLHALNLANRNKNGDVASIHPITSNPFYLLPQHYAAVTTDKQDLLKQYLCKNPQTIIETAKMPSYPNTSGTVVLIRTDHTIIDEVSYQEDEQYALFHNNEGVSLEKINATGSSNDPKNWQSASSVAGYATPTYLNSASNPSDNATKTFKLQPEIFSPDGDGIDDQAVLTYKLERGASVNILVYNEYGRPVRHLLSNAYLGGHGKIIWNGKDDKGHILPTGAYIFFIALYRPSGTVKNMKIPVVLAKRRK